MDTEKEYWPCHCVTWQEAGEFKLAWCGSRHCRVYQTVLAESKNVGNPIVYRIERNRIGSR